MSDKGNNGNGKSDVELTGMAAFTQYLWNSNTGEFCGRTGSSWAKILLFYIVFYALLAAFWAFMLYIFLETINDERPKWTLDESRIGSNPGLGFRPSPNLETVDSTLISFRPGNADSYSAWKADLDKYLDQYREAYRKSSSSCRGFYRRDQCPFIVNVDANPCGRDYGYADGNPCVLIKLNRIFDWKPEPFRTAEELKRYSVSGEDQNLNRSDIIINKQDELHRGEGMVVLSCKGENAADKESLGRLDYWPMQGFPLEYYPYVKKDGYLSPFVFVKFNSVRRGTTISIECTAWAKNIAIKKADREGLLRFELRVDE